MGVCVLHICIETDWWDVLYFLDLDSLDEMGNSINELEQSINELRAEMGAEGSPSPLAPPKSKPDEVKPDDS